MSLRLAEMVEPGLRLYFEGGNFHLYGVGCDEITLLEIWEFDCSDGDKINKLKKWGQRAYGNGTIHSQQSDTHVGEFILTLKVVKVVFTRFIIIVEVSNAPER